MSFDYSTTGLPEKNEWKIAVAICYQWLEDHMKPEFGEKGITRFMHNQPVSAAKRIIENAPDSSDELITSVLLGPAKDRLVVLSGDNYKTDEEYELQIERERRSRQVFGDRTVDFIHALIDPSKVKDADMQRDLNRLFLVEGLSTMKDQLINRHKRVGKTEEEDHYKRFKDHQTRWNILNHLETRFAAIKGENPAIDVIFEGSIKKSRESLDILDKEISQKKPMPKPPGMKP